MSGEKIILALDSSSRSLSFAALGRGARPCSVETGEDFRHAETVIPMIDRVLKKAGLRIDQIEALACGMGPGSFTGLRVGLAAIKAIMLARGIPCFVASSLDLIAFNAAEEIRNRPAVIRVLVDARRSRYYTAQYRLIDGDTLIKEDGDRILTTEEICSTLIKEAVFLGDGVVTFRSEAGRLGFACEALRFCPEKTWFPRAVNLIYFVQRGSPLLKSVSIEEVKPAYLRPTEPEERLMKSRENV